MRGLWWQEEALEERLLEAQFQPRQLAEARPVEVPASLDRNPSEPQAQPQEEELDIDLLMEQQPPHVQAAWARDSWLQETEPDTGPTVDELDQQQLD